MAICDGNGETRVSHAERSEQTPSHHLAKRRVFHPGEQQAKQIDGSAIVKTRARLIDQGEGA